MTPSPPDAAATLRAFCEAIVPGLDADPTPGAPEVAAERFVAHYLGEARVAALVTMLDEAAGARRFVELEAAARTTLVGRLAERPNVRVATALTLAAVYGSWSGHDEQGVLAGRPLGWDLTGYAGPVRARAELTGE